MIATPLRIEPCLFDERIPAELADLTVEVQRAADKLGAGLHHQSAAELADLVRVMNCYYSNLIEGHNTHPKDIERALTGAELEEETRPLALEARAHVVVQREIDEMAQRAMLPPPTSSEFLSWSHRGFYEEMPGDFRFIEHSDGRLAEIVPGRIRMAGDPEMAVGRHVPPSSHRVQAFLAHFNDRYRSAEHSASGRMIAIAAAHHRVNYIHPFLDGNGRVSRLMSHAMALQAGIAGHGLWSISRGLARGLSDRGE